LAKQFEALGMKTAFDQPKGSANFDKIAPRHRRLPLHLADFSQDVHRVDEKGTEAAAATAVAMLAGQRVCGHLRRRRSK
jgi:serine protease inhibitor